MGFRKAAVAGTAGAVAAVTLLGVAATPAFAKSSSTLSGPRVARAGHPFGLTVTVGDDAGAQPAKARLEVRGAHGRFQWVGGWHSLRRNSYWFESWTFNVTERHRGPETFRAVLSGYYGQTNTVTVSVR
jgi:hypothetical protein